MSSSSIKDKQNEINILHKLTIFDFTYISKCVHYFQPIIGSGQIILKITYLLKELNRLYNQKLELQNDDDDNDNDNDSDEKKGDEKRNTDDNDDDNDNDNNNDDNDDDNDNDDNNDDDKDDDVVDINFTILLISISKCVHLYFCFIFLSYSQFLLLFIEFCVHICVYVCMYVCIFACLNVHENLNEHMC